MWTRRSTETEPELDGGHDPFESPLPGRERPGRWVVRARVRRPRAGWLLLLALLVGLAAAGLAGTGYRYHTFRADELPAPELPTETKALDRALGKLRSDNRRLQASLQRKLPTGTYLVIDQTNNRLYVKNGDKVQFQAVCSAGSGMLLREQREGGRSWIFDTPRGAFKVLNKLQDPVWKKPDWAFVEEGKPIPVRAEDRFEYGVLGEYALYFGNGYMIHGTLYERLLGRSVTHGCIRLGKDDLARVWHDAPIGTTIFIF
ncbi:MAG TPA: L,D-transpeptidase [Candidatus Polarisedimenticolaceae bacterium]|nr:L,D-transpeptidase [Candidatus Polarisedimenticolaceae bacterium]